MGEAVKDFVQVLSPELVAGKSVTDLAIAQLTAVGENYGSIMLAIDVQLEDTKTGKKSTLNTVAKTVPKDEIILTIFQPHLTFKKEIELYKTIVPTLQDFQRRNGVEDVFDAVAKFYGGRIGLSDPEKFDTDAVLLLENMKVEGYTVEDRCKGFDFETAVLVLQKLAEFHALPLALRKKEPRVFEEKIKPYLNEVILPKKKSDHGDPLEVALNAIKEDEVCAKHYSKIKACTQRILSDARLPEANLELLGTVTHRDFWVCNVMIKPVGGKVEEVRLVDFQMTSYDTPGMDLSFFLFSSVENELIVERFDDLLEVYRERFCDTLEKVGVDSRPYTLDVFKKDIGDALKRLSLDQCLFMLFPIFVKKEHLERLNGDYSKFYQQPVSQEYIAKMRLQVTEFVKRGWLD